MTLEISIITEDSDAKLPPINKWKGTLGKGKNIESIPEIKSLLNTHGLTYPTNDIENEELYLRILKNYVRPSKYMFAGNYGGIRDLAKNLKNYGEIKSYILSGRYGLIEEDRQIIPYSYHLSSEEKLSNLDKKTNFIKMMKIIYEKSDIFIVSFPIYLLDYIIKNEVFNSKINNLGIVICSSSFKEIMEEKGFIVFPRIGVARIGKENRKRIINIIQNSI